MGKSKDLATGASYVDTSGDTMTGNLLLGSNSIGLGTTSPDEKLHVEGSILVDAFNAGNETGIFFREGFTSSNKYNQSILAYDTDGSPDGISINGYGGVSICTGSNSRQERFKVDNSGRMTVPSQPFFQAFSPATGTAAGSDIVYGGTYHNIGSHYSTSTGIFTAPIAGRYLFTASCLFNYASGGYHRLNFRFNGSISNSYAETLENQAGPSYSTATISAIFNMSANDTMKMSNGSSVSTYGNSYGHFSGILLG